MSTPDIPTFDFQHIVAQQFGDRPTLRQVASQQLLKVLLAKLPWLASVQPALEDADPLMLDSPDPATAYWTTQPFVDRVLQALLDAEPLDLEPVDGRYHNLGLTAAYRFAGSSSEFDTRQLSDLSASLQALVECLPQYFCDAQLEYWNAQGSAGVSRDRWLQLLLQTALLRGLPLQGLDTKEQACLRGLIRGGPDQPQVFFVQVSLTAASLQFDELQCHMLVLGEWDERQVVLWCAPSGAVRSYPSLTAFGQALRNDLAQRYQFEQMSWHRYSVEGNVFAQQVSLMLESLFSRVDRLRYLQVVGTAQLEQRFAQTSDPARWFASYVNETPALKAPPGLLSASAQDSFAYCSAMLQLALDQLDGEGRAALDGIQCLNEYTRQQLSKQMSKDHQDHTSPDDLVLQLSLARGVPGGSATGAGGGEALVYAGEKTLTEFAIGNLSSLKGAAITQILRSDGNAAPDWLDAEAARQLVAQVDIGGRYPAYVAAELDDTNQRPERVARFAREWRSALTLSAMAAKLEGKVSEAGLQCVVDFCAGWLHPVAPRISFFPLAFRRSQTSRKKDRVRGMYVLFCAEPAVVLLYRPLYTQDTVREYASLEALLESVRESEILQGSLLDWMAQDVRHIYENGGFAEPHITHIGLDPYELPERPKPAVLDIALWRSDLDEKLYSANRDLLVELADMQSVSNVESRWEVLSQGAWLLFDVATLLVRGPVATVAWLVQLLGSLQNDLTSLEQGGEFDRSAAVADLLLNIGMALLHVRQPALAVVPKGEALDASAYEGPALQRGAFSEVGVSPTETPSKALGDLAAIAGQQLDFSWRGNNGFNWLPAFARKKLEAMRSSVALNGLVPMAVGEGAGLYQVDGNHYAVLASDVYRVELKDGNVRVVGKDGSPGPWLARVDGAWRVDNDLRYLGGMPPKAIQEKLAKRFREAHEAVNQFDLRANAAMAECERLSKSVLDLQGRINKLTSLKAIEQAKLGALPEGADTTASVRIIAQYDSRIAQWTVDIANLREETVQSVEKAVEAEAAMLPLLTTLQEPKFANERKKGGWEGTLPLREAQIQVSLIRKNDFIFNELWGLAKYSELGALQQALHGRPLADVGELYVKLRRKLEQVARIQDRMLVAHEHLDALLVDAADQLEITGALPEYTQTVAQLIAQRSFTTVQLRFNQVLNLADLALHLDAPEAQSTLAGYRDEIAGNVMRNAAEAHGELDLVTVSIDDKVVILQEAWDEYTTALLDSERILKEGGALIEPAMLERYREHVRKLKLDAGRRLVEAIREQDGHPQLRQRVPYVVSGDVRRVVRNTEGQLLIGTETTVDGQRVVEVRELFTGAVMSRFDWVDDTWREREDEAPEQADPSYSGDMAMQVQALQDESEGVIDKAKSYVANDIKGASLARLFDRQLARVDQLATTLSDRGGSDMLVKALEHTGDQLRAAKNLQLTLLYTDTRYPSAAALQFLHTQGLIKVEYTERRTMLNGSAFDEYKIMRLTAPGASQGRNLWVAHFHLPSADAFAEQFTEGHLKTWSQRRMSGREEIGSGQRVHRGKLTLEQARGIIPFH
ncbi:hypothetical protein DV532_23345 [Pseudomonas sp. Leaf58]|uniref:DUF6543 domain-containing protein n=1 Tax=Pseudomonas sp. Leaf58 TaxID=1736226 RepID=UPI0006F530CB|nr:DUF6543 domain-containing protein [Pseudomonas sp. Leaf58]AYG47068.1 hypothetical protein DV532_23345 [Pseudomonas sp. Leaf58]KQN66479.1 hypothetical protein ASF02_02370 [Pseudomonas sp. Leaf58]